MDCFGFLKNLNRKHLKNNSTRTTATTNNYTMNDATSTASPDTKRTTTLACESPSHDRYEDGRRFHTGQKVDYVLPNDMQEDDRLHLQHWIVKLAFGSNFDAPVQQALEEGTNVLDSACGPGTWTLEMANAYPDSKFYGTDISSRFPDQIKPGNSEFCVQNVLDDPSFDENYFGYIHQRLLILGIKKDDWPTVLRNIKFTLKPGGWVELTEFSYGEPHNAGSLIKFANEINVKMMAKGGFDPNLGSNLTQLLCDTGFTNVQERSIDIPVNHGGELGQLFWENTKELSKSTKPVFAKFSPEFQKPGAYEKYIEDLGEEFKAYKSTVRWTRAIAQKPLTG